MSTWHQERAGSPLPVLWHHTKWTVVYPGSHLCVSRFVDRVEAYTEMDRFKGSYVIDPVPIPGREDSTIATTQGNK